jgi:hypothetical protein
MMITIRNRWLLRWLGFELIPGLQTSAGMSLGLWLYVVRRRFGLP